MPVTLSDCRPNRFLAALDPVDLARWLPWLDALEVPAGAVLVEAHARQSHVFFPITAVIALARVMPGGAAVEVAVAGREGFVGLPIVLGGESAPDRATVRLAGRLLRLPARCVEAEMAHGTGVRRQLLRFASGLLGEAQHTATCAT